MRTLATRELIVATRTAAVPLAALLVLMFSTALVLVWMPGVPMLTPANLYEQARAVHWILLAGVLPWAAVRCSPVDRNDAVVLMAALVRARPGAAVSAKVLGSCAVLMTIVLTGLPALVLAQQAAAVPLARVFADLLPVAGLALLVAATATAAILFAADELRAWLWTSSIVVGVLLLAARWTSGSTAIGWLCAAGAVVATAVGWSAVGRSRLNPVDSDGL
jgi:hypothetical protein